MRVATIVAATLLVGGLHGTSLADPLAQQLEELNGVADVFSAATAANRYNMDLEDLTQTKNKELREKIAQEIAVRRILGEIAEGKWGASNFVLKDRASAIWGAENVYGLLNYDAELAHFVSLRLNEGEETEMHGPEVGVGPKGQLIRVPPKWELPIKVPEVDLDKLPTDNEKPNIFSLGFSAAFLVEIKAPGGVCTGSLVRQALVLTAKHCLQQNNAYVDPSAIVVRSVSGTTPVKGTAILDRPNG